MADYSGTGFDPSSYNADSAAQQVALQRAMAQRLMQTQVPTQGQIVPGGPNGFYVKPSALSQIAAALQQGVGGLMEAKSIDKQNQNDKDSQAALEYQLKHLNDQNQEGSKVQFDAPVTSTPGWDGPTSSAPSSAVPPMPEPPASQGATTTALPPQPQTQISALPPVTPPAPAPLPIRPGQQTSGPNAVQAQAISQLSRSGKGFVAPPVKAPDPSDVTSLLKVTNEKGTFTVPDTMANRWEYRNKFEVVPLIQDQNSAPTPPAQPSIPPAALAAQLQKPPGTPPVAPPPPQGTPPQPSPVQGPAPQTSGAVPPMPQPAPQAPQGPQAVPPIDHSLDPISVTTQRASVVPNMVAPDQGTQLARMAALAKTGKMGERISDAMLANMGPHSGRYKDVADKDGNVTGIVDTSTGQYQQFRQAAPNPASVEAELKDWQNTDASKPDEVAAHNRRFPNMQPRQLGTSNMTSDQRVTQNRNDQDQQTKLAKQHEDYQSSISGIQGLLNQLDRMDHLYDQTTTGPMAGNLPAWTDNRQELKNLTGSNVFAGVREAVDGAGGGSQRFTQGELQHFANGNGGLSLSTSAPVAHNIIAQQRAVLEAKLKALQAADKATPSTQGSVSIPARGQTFNGPNSAAASALGIQ